MLIYQGFSSECLVEKPYTYTPVFKVVRLLQEKVVEGGLKKELNLCLSPRDYASTASVGNALRYYYLGA